MSGCWLEASGQQWVEKLEGSNQASEGVLRAHFEHWMPLSVSPGKPTRYRIQITTDFIPAKASSNQTSRGLTHVCSGSLNTEAEERTFLILLLTAAK